MQLDDYRIAIRERGFLELMDLSLRVIRAHAAPLAVALLIGIGPMVLLNALLIPALEHDEEPGAYFAYCYFTLLLVLWQIPIATAPATLYLGQALFAERPDAKTIARNFLVSLPQLIFYQIVLRAVLLLMCVTWFVPFVLRPYMNEVILLERNPFRTRRKDRMTTWRRASALHGSMGGEFFNRAMGSAAFSLMLLGSVWGSLWCLRGLLLNEWSWDGPVYSVFYPAALWIVAAFFTIVRFLGYLDLRIRREGWEVELLMRAEEARCTRQWT
jgi:hypothetical protein